MSFLASIGWKVVPRIGPVSPHGLGIALGYAIGGTMTARRAERLYGIAREHVWNMLMYAVIGVVVGARLFYVVGHIRDYIPDDPVGILRVWEGGIVFYGGLIGGVVAAVPYMRKHGFSFFQLMDAMAPGLTLGLVIGRIGDLVIGDHLGGPTTMPWGFRYEGGQLPDRVLPIGAVVHQTALYDMVSALVLFPIVMWLGRKRRPDGWLMGFTITWYAAGRLASDFGRDAPTYAGLRGTQWVSVALILFGMIRLAQVARRSPALQVATPVGLDEQAARMLDEGAPVHGADGGTPTTQADGHDRLAVWEPTFMPPREGG